jgi:hypothetical protein
MEIDSDPKKKPVVLNENKVNPFKQGVVRGKKKKHEVIR